MEKFMVIFSSGLVLLTNKIDDKMIEKIGTLISKIISLEDKIVYDGKEPYKPKFIKG